MQYPLQQFSLISFVLQVRKNLFDLLLVPFPSRQAHMPRFKHGMQNWFTISRRTFFISTHLLLYKVKVCQS